MLPGKKIPLSAVVLLLLAGCFGKVAKKEKKDFDAFPVETNLKETVLVKLDNLAPDLIDLYHDSVLLLINRSVKEGHHFALYHLKDKKYLPPQLEFGRKDWQSLSFLSCGSVNNDLWAYDINKEKIVFSTPGSAPDTGGHARTLKVPGFYYSVHLLNDSMLVASGDYDSPLDYKVALVNLTSGNVEQRIAPYAVAGEKAFTRPQKMAYESFLYMKPSQEKCVLACRYSDRIEIIDMASHESKVVQGPEGFVPQMIVMTSRDGKKLSARGPDTRYAFVKGKTTNRFIYLLYSGNKDRTKHRFYGKDIYVYSWDGMPVKKIALNDDIEDFAVTGNDSLIYTYNPASKNISVANIQ